MGYCRRSEICIVRRYVHENTYSIAVWRILHAPSFVGDQRRIIIASMRNACKMEMVHAARSRVILMLKNQCSGHNLSVESNLLRGLHPAARSRFGGCALLTEMCNCHYPKSPRPDLAAKPEASRGHLSTRNHRNPIRSFSMHSYKSYLLRYRLHFGRVGVVAVRIRGPCQRPRSCLTKLQLEKSSSHARNGT